MVSSDFSMHTSSHAQRAPSPRKHTHKVRASGSCLSSEMPRELIAMTAPHVPTSPSRQTYKDIRPIVQQRRVTPNPSAANPSKTATKCGARRMPCVALPCTSKYSQDASAFNHIVNQSNTPSDNNAPSIKTSTFAARDQFETIAHIHAKREAVELTHLQIHKALKKNREQRKPPVFDLTSHKYIGSEDKFQYLRHSPRSLDMKMHAANHLSMVQEPVDPHVNPIHPHHNGLNHDIKHLHRALEIKDDKRNTAHWQKDYTHVSNVPSWEHMAWRHQPIDGNENIGGHELCAECKSITALKSNVIYCRNCGAFESSLKLPSSSTSQFSPRNVRGLDLTQLPMRGEEEKGGRKEHRYAVGMSKTEHAKVWKINRDLTVSCNKWKIAAKNADARRKKASFRAFRSKPPSKDMGLQQSPRYRNGVFKAERGYAMLTRRAGRGDARVEANLRMDSSCPVVEQMFVEGPLNKR